LDIQVVPEVWRLERAVLCHRMKRAQARLLLPTDEAAQAERLAVGSAVLWRTSGATATVQIPLTTAADVRRVAGLLATGRLPHQPDGSQNEADLQQRICHRVAKL
jgi:hypothetical protein